MGGERIDWGQVLRNGEVPVEGTQLCNFHSMIALLEAQGKQEVKRLTLGGTMILVYPGGGWEPRLFQETTALGAPRSLSRSSLLLTALEWDPSAPEHPRAA